MVAESKDAADGGGFADPRCQRFSIEIGTVDRSEVADPDVACRCYAEREVSSRKQPVRVGDCDDVGVAPLRSSGLARRFLFRV